MPYCKLLSDQITKYSQETIEQYKDRLYSEYIDAFYTNKFTFRGKPVALRHEPKVGKYENSFHHLTTKVFKANTSFQHREFDYARAERIRWIKELLLSHPCYEGCCNGILEWKENNRVHLFLEIESYLIVLEERKNYYLLVSAYYVMNGKERDKLLKRYNRAV